MTSMNHWQFNHRNGNTPLSASTSAFGRENNASNNKPAFLNLPSRIIPQDSPEQAATFAPTNKLKQALKDNSASEAVNKLVSETEYLEQRQKEMETWFAENMGMPPTEKLAVGAAAGAIPSFFLSKAFGLKHQFDHLREAKPNAPIYKFAHKLDRLWGVRHVSDAIDKYLAEPLSTHRVADPNKRPLWNKITDWVFKKAGPEIDNVLQETKSVDVIRNHVDEGMKAIEHLAPHRRYANSPIGESLPKDKKLFSQRVEELIQKTKSMDLPSNKGGELLPHEQLSERYKRVMNAVSKLSLGKKGEAEIIRQFYTAKELKDLYNLDPQNVTIKQLQQKLNPGILTRLFGKPHQFTGPNAIKEQTALHNIIQLAKREKKYLRHLLGVQTRLEGFTNMHMYIYHVEKGLMDTMRGDNKVAGAFNKKTGPVGRFVVSLANTLREVLDGSFVTGGSQVTGKGFMASMAKMGKNIMPIMVPAMAIGMPLYEAGKAKKGDRLATFMHHLLGYEFGFFIGWQVGRSLLNELNVNTKLGKLIDWIPKTIEKGLNKGAKMLGSKNPEKYVGKFSHWMFKSKKIPVLSLLFGRVSMAGFLMFMVFSQSFANRLKGRFEKISHAIFGYPESVRETEAKEKAEELAAKLETIPPTFRNHTQTKATSLTQEGLPSLGFQTRARRLLHRNNTNTLGQSNKNHPSPFTRFNTQTNPSASPAANTSTSAPAGSGSLSNFRNVRGANQMENNQTTSVPANTQETTAPIGGSKLNPLRFFNKKTTPKQNIATTNPKNQNNQWAVETPAVDPFENFDPTSIKTVPSDLPAQLAEEQHKLSDILSWQTA